MKQSIHTIEFAPWESLNTGTRVVLEITTALLWPLKPEDRVTALITLLADALGDFTESEGEIDAIIDVLRLQMKLGLQKESPPLQWRN